MKTVPKTAFVAVDKNTAPMLLELLTKAAASGPDAAKLAKLYAAAQGAAMLLAPTPAKPKADEA